MADTPKKRSAFSKPDEPNGSGGYGASEGYSGGGLEPGNSGDFTYSGGSGDNYGIPDIKTSLKLPERVKVDLNTPLETCLTGLGFICIGVIIFLAIEGTCGHTAKYSRQYTPPDPELLKYIPCAIIAAAASFISRYFTDNYYIFDTIQKKIYYHFCFYGYESVTPYLNQENIRAIGVTGVRQQSKHSTWWDYKIVVIDRDGKITDFSDLTRDSRIAFNSQARGMAAVMQCHFAECPPEARIRVQRHGSEVNVYFDDCSSFFNAGSCDFSTTSNPPFLIAILAVIIIISFLIFFIRLNPF